MIRRPPRSTRTDTLFPYATLFRSAPSEAGLEPVPVRVVAVLDPALNKNQRSTRTSAQQEDEEGTAMSRHVYSVTEIYGSSPDSLDDAIRNAVGTASHSLRNLEWFEVTEIRGHIDGDKISHFQVGVKLGFRYEK